MQAFIDSEIMSEKKIDIIILERLETQQKEMNKRVDEVDGRLAALGEKIGEIRGALDAPHKSWFMRYVAAPLIVAGILGAVAEVSWLHIRLSKLETSVTGSIAKLQLQQSATVPADPTNIKEAKNTLDEVKKKKIKIPVEIVRNTGIKFIEAAQTNPEAWSVAEQFLSYRSFLNADFAPRPSDLTPATGQSKYRPTVNIVPNPEHPEEHRALSVYFAGGHVGNDKAARLESLDQPQPEGSEFGLFVIEGGADTIGLDGEYMKNVIIRNANVAYSGGSLKLENVIFVNCTFNSLRWTPGAREFSERLLASNAVSLDLDVSSTVGYLTN